MIPLQPKHLALAPIYLYQGLKLKKTALRLPEAAGDRQGVITLSQSNNDSSAKELKTKLNLMVVGDSSAAGVGVVSQKDALIGHLIKHISDNKHIIANLNEVHWELHATSGHTTYDVLRRLYVLKTPAMPTDILVFLIGVNDTTSNISYKIWQQQLRQLIELAFRKFSAQKIFFVSVPPMQTMPAIPKPLNTLLGSKSELMNIKLKEICDDYENVDVLTMNLANTGLTSSELFARDGFHPNSTAYSFLALKISNKIAELLNNQALKL